MPTLDLKPKARKFIQSLPPKHQRQVKDSILSLQGDPAPQDAKKLIGYKHYTRIDCGEYRIIYRHENKKDLLTVALVGKRNDDGIYKIAKRNLK